jgi:polysaccharide export outer membrane protein
VALLSITPELIRKQRSAVPSEIAQDVKSLFGTARPYRIGPGDVISVVVWSHPEIVFPVASALTTTDPSGTTAAGNGFSVDPDGLIQFPYVGAVKVGGLTELEARDLLLRESSKFLKGPQLTVRVMAFRSERVYIDGEVRLPGLLAVNDVALTLPDAISRAGGFTAVADRSAVALTRGQRTMLISMPQLSQLGVNPASILLSGGDLVRVLSQEDSKVYVMGEVNRPAPILMRNGRISLNQALGEAGGVNPGSGDPRQIYVVRNAAVGKPEVYHLDAASPVALALAEEFELKPRDVVFVDPAPLALWNRVISLLIPSASLVNTSLSIKNQ